MRSFATPYAALPVLAAILILAAILAPAAAQNYAYVTHPNLASGGSNSYPFSSTPASWRYQMFYDRNHLPRTRVRITDLAFGSSVSNPSLFEASQFEVRMAHNTVGSLSTVFANNFSTPPVTLFSGVMKYQAVYQTWVDLGLTSPFMYDGTSHLVLEIRYRNRTKTGSSMRSDSNMARVWNNTAADPFAATTGTMRTNYGLMTRITYDSITLLLSGAPSPGGTITLNMEAPPAANQPYQAASSLGTGPIKLGTRAIGLTVDDLMALSVGGLVPTVFVDFSGKLDAAGKATARLKIPNHAALKGLRIYNAFVTLDVNAPFGVGLISSTERFSIL